MSQNPAAKRTDVISSALGILHSEDLVVEAVQDLIKDEIKQQIRNRIMADKAVREELKDAVSLYLEYKIKELYAASKLAKAGAKVSLNLIPENLKKEVSSEFEHLIEDQITAFMEKSLD